MLPTPTFDKEPKFWNPLIFLICGFLFFLRLLLPVHCSFNRLRCVEKSSSQTLQPDKIHLLDNILFSK